MRHRPLFALALLLVLTACKRKPPVDEAAVFAAIRENVDAMQREDMAAVMATIHPAGGQMDEARELFADLFERFDLKYDVSELKIIDRTDEEVAVHFFQKTERIGGEPFEDNAVEGFHVLRRDDGRWKLVRSVQRSRRAILPRGPGGG